VRSLAPVRLLAIAIALTGLIALSTPVAASAKQPCWKDIMDDWYPDESIDGSYSQACYRAADKNIPQDLRDYSDLPNEIARARMRDIRDSREETGSGRDRVPQSVGGAGPVDDRNDDGGGGGTTGDSGGNPSDGAIGSALDALGPESADSAPIPLLVLAGLAMLLVAAGGAGLLTRRLQARRARVGGPPPGPQV
jgi:hypothetical protein